MLSQNDSHTICTHSYTNMIKIIHKSKHSWAESMLHVNYRVHSLPMWLWLQRIIQLIEYTFGHTIFASRWNLRHSPTSCKKNAYLTLVPPVLEYAAIIWDLHTQQEINMLERVQRNAVHFTAEDYHSTMPGFITRLLRNMSSQHFKKATPTSLGFFYKVVESLVPVITLCNFITPHSTETRMTHPLHERQKHMYTVTKPSRKLWLEQRKTKKMNNRCYCLPETHTDQYRHAYKFPKTIIEWNNLDDTIVHQKSIDSFKSALAKARSQQYRRTAHPYCRTYASKSLNQ